MDDVGDQLCIEDWNGKHWGEFRKHDIILLTAVNKKVLTQSKYSLSNYAPVIMVRANNEHKAPEESGLNWSEVSYEEEFCKAKELTIAEAIGKKNMIAGSFDTKNFYKLRNCQIFAVTNIFKLLDANNRKLLLAIDDKKVVEEVTGNERDICSDDQITYALNMTLKDSGTDQILYCNGWDPAGKSIFQGSPAEDLYYNFTSNELTQALFGVKTQLFNFLIKLWTREEKTGWTVEKVFEITEYNVNSEENEMNMEFSIKTEKQVTDLTK